MNKKLIAYLLVSCISLFLPYNPVNAAVKAGGVCIKAGLTSVASNKTYTCVKSGKRLVWNKGTTTAPPVAVQPPWLKGYSEISSISRNNKIDFNLEDIEISSHVDTKLVGNLLKYQNLVSSYWKSYGFESQYPIHILILSEKDYPTYLKHSTERKFSCSDVCNENNWFSPSFSSKFQGTVQVENLSENLAGRASPTGLTILYVIGTEMVSKNYNWAPDLATAFTHEFGHVIQFSYLEGWKNFGHMACWNNEGFPAFFEDALYFENKFEKSKMNLLAPPNGTFLSWLSLRRTIRENGFKNDANSVFNSLGISYSGSDSDWTKFFTYTDTRNSEGCALVGYGRNHGSIISRLFYEDFGAKSFLEILNNTNQKKDWKSAFVATTGKEYDSWLKERVFPEFKKIK
ncbi:MAG: hypothetical protein RLZZ154_828 [Actinomycetota bacterium]